MSIQVVGSEGCRCLGDALRDLDAKSLIRGHFLLMGCDTVTNAQLSTVFEQHRYFKTRFFQKSEVIRHYSKKLYLSFRGYMIYTLPLN